MVPTEEASIQKTEEKLKAIEILERSVGSALQRYSLVRHFLNKLQANLSLSDTPHSTQQKKLSILSRVICVEKMLLEFGNDFCPPCKPIAWIWHEGDDPIRHHPIAIIVVVDVHLRQIHALSWFTRTFT
jgi:thiol-disulfide isomerase/thioredoxin